MGILQPYCNHQDIVPARLSWARTSSLGSPTPQTVEEFGGKQAQEPACSKQPLGWPHKQVGRDVGTNEAGTSMGPLCVPYIQARHQLIRRSSVCVECILVSIRLKIRVKC
jgi:hypothetical protein